MHGRGNTFSLNDSGGAAAAMVAAAAGCEDRCGPFITKRKYIHRRASAASSSARTNASLMYFPPYTLFCSCCALKVLFLISWCSKCNYYIGHLQPTSQYYFTPNFSCPTTQNAFKVLKITLLERFRLLVLYWPRVTYYSLYFGWPVKLMLLQIAVGPQNFLCGNHTWWKTT